MSTTSSPELDTTTEKAPTHAVVRCAGRVVSETAQSLKTTVKPLFAESKIVLLDLTDVTYMDSSGLGTIVGLWVSAKAAGSQLRLVNLNQRLKELFSITRLGQVMAEGRNPEEMMAP